MNHLCNCDPDTSRRGASPAAEASIASPTMVEQEKVVKQTYLPKAAPKETDDPQPREVTSSIIIGVP